MNLDSPRCPGLSLLEIVDNKCPLVLPCHNIFVFARSLKLVTANVEACAIKLEARDIDIRLSIWLNGCQPGKQVRLKIRFFLVQKHTGPCSQLHNISRRQSISQKDSLRSLRG